MTGGISDIVDKCEAGVHLTINAHRDVYKSVADYLDGSFDDVEPDTLGRMIATDTVVRLQFYPDTPIGFYCVWHYDVDAAVSVALEILEDLR